MGENSGIAWTDHTWNPWIGCTKVSPGCEHCYAEAYDARFGGGHWGSGAPRRRTAVKTWNALRRLNREAKASGVRAWVFVASLADVFDNEVPHEWRRDAFDVMRECDALNFQIVTKRVGNAFCMLPDDWATAFRHCGIVATVVTQAECDRDLPKLLTLKKQRGVGWVGLSIEPQLESVIPKDAEGLDWIITAGESDQGGALGREYRVSWAGELIAWGEARGVAIFVKQLGSHFARANNFTNRAGADPSEWWPPELRVRQMPFSAPTTLRAAMWRECDRFNAEHPTGSTIKVWPGVIGKGGRCVEVAIVEPGAHVLGGHTPVVQVDGGFGCIALTHVERV